MASKPPSQEFLDDLARLSTNAPATTAVFPSSGPRVIVIPPPALRRSNATAGQPSLSAAFATPAPCLPTAAASPDAPSEFVVDLRIVGTAPLVRSVVARSLAALRVVVLEWEDVPMDPEVDTDVDADA